MLSSFDVMLADREEVYDLLPSIDEDKHGVGRRLSTDWTGDKDLHRRLMFVIDD